MPAATPAKSWKTGRSANSVRVPTVLQMEAVECGAACLTMVLAYYQKWEPLREVRDRCGVTRDGASALDLVKAARSYGRKASGSKGGIDALVGRRLPVILWWNRNHFVVLESIRRGRYQINDPGVGRVVMGSEAFRRSYSGLAISLEPSDEFERSGGPYRILPRVVARLRGSTDGVALAALCGLVAVVPALAVPVVSSVFVNLVLSGGRSDLILALVTVIVAAAAVRGVLMPLQNMAQARLQLKLSLVGATTLLGRLLLLPLRFFDQRSTGDLAGRVGQTGAVSAVIAGQAATAVLSVFTLAAYAAVMMLYSWSLGMIVLALALLNVVALRIAGRRQVNSQALLLREQAAVQTATVSSLQQIETIKASGLEADAYRRWAGLHARSVSAAADGATPGILLSAVPALINALTAMAILLVGAFGVVHGTLTVGGVVAFQLLAGGVSGPLLTLVLLAAQLQTMTAQLARIDDVLDEHVDVRFAAPKSDAGDKEHLAGRLTLSAVTFGYSPRQGPVVESLSMDIPPGARVALVGPSGCGKSTLGALAAGLMQPWSGVVAVDGQPIGSLPVGQLTQAVSRVDQTILLMAGTVRENISLWDATVSDSAILRALSDAAIVDDVLARPGGLDAVVLEGGRNFSGGQRQRLEIARALVRDPAILILDEATSALDAETELAIDRALRIRGITCLIVAHRLSTIRDADEILVLGRGGRVLERGSHVALLSAQGMYAQLNAGADSVGV